MKSKLKYGIVLCLPFIPFMCSTISSSAASATVRGSTPLYSDIIGYAALAAFIVGILFVFVIPLPKKKG